MSFDGVFTFGRYWTLNREYKEILLVKLHPAELAEAVRCSLLEGSLGDIDSIQKYEALSYVWGAADVVPIITEIVFSM